MIPLHATCVARTQDRTKKARSAPPAFPRKYVTAYPNPPPDRHFLVHISPVTPRLSPAMHRSLFLSLGAVMHLLCGLLFLMQLGTEHVFSWAISNFLIFF